MLRCTEKKLGLFPLTLPGESSSELAPFPFFEKRTNHHQAMLDSPQGIKFKKSLQQN